MPANWIIISSAESSPRGSAAPRLSACMPGSRTGTRGSCEGARHRRPPKSPRSGTGLHCRSGRSAQRPSDRRRAAHRGHRRPLAGRFGPTRGPSCCAGLVFVPGWRVGGQVVKTGLNSNSDSRVIQTHKTQKPMLRVDGDAVTCSRRSRLAHKAHARKNMEGGRGQARKALGCVRACLRL